MPSVTEVTLALAALANPARREVAYRAAIWQAGNGSYKRSAAQTTLIAAWWCEAGGTTAGRRTGAQSVNRTLALRPRTQSPVTTVDLCVRAL